MTVTVPQIDIVTKEVTEKLDYFERKVNSYAGDGDCSKFCVST
ncbi:hypothetical protein [Acinetobacter ursingii]|nr:hypothetical protein [Acinetobacter ursingii]